MREKLVVVATTLLVAATRVLALARSPWEWDELAFCLGVRNYDVIHHFPHPPGFPLFIAFAKVFRFLGLPDFRALQMVVLLGAIALFPLTYLLARELGFSFGVALGGALMLVFAPNVWFYGGTAFSDIPTLALTLAACVLLLRGVLMTRPSPGLRPLSPGGRGVSAEGGSARNRVIESLLPPGEGARNADEGRGIRSVSEESGREAPRPPAPPDSSLTLPMTSKMSYHSLWPAKNANRGEGWANPRSRPGRLGMTAGAILLGIAAAFRPQSLLVGLVPLLLHRRRALIGIAIVVAIVVAAYLGAAIASGSITKYVDAVKAQQKWVHDVDSFHNPTRPPLRAIFKTFFKPTRGAGNADRVIPILAAIGALWTLRTRDPKAAILIAMFLPLNVFSWLMLDFNAASRYVVSYAPMCTILAAEGLRVIALPFRDRADRVALAASVVIATFLAIGGLPAIRELHSQTSPLVAAADWIRASVPHDARLYVSGNLEMHADYYLSDYHVVLVEGRRPTDGYLFDDARSRRRGAVNFTVPSAPLFDIARQRFFEASVSPP
jgi:hypothetical protein